MFKIDMEDLSKQIQEIQDALDAASKGMLSNIRELVDAEGRSYAAKHLKSGLPFWNKSFKVHPIVDDMLIITVGENAGIGNKSLDSWMGGMLEDGMPAGAISKAIMKGNRAEYNAAHSKSGKKYVDVPISQNADQMSGNMTLGKNGPTVNVKAFKSADDMLKSVSAHSKDVKFSNWKSGGVTTQKRLIDRVQNVIKSVEASSKVESYITIRRVTEDSEWPKNFKPGIKVLDHLDKFIDNHLEEIINSVL